MKDTVTKYMLVFIEGLICMYSIMLVLSIYQNLDLVNGNFEQSIITDGILVEYEVNDVKCFEIVDTILDLNSLFDWKEHVIVHDVMDNNLINYVTVIGEVDTSIVGEYKMCFILQYNGKYMKKDIIFYVNEE